MPNQAEQQRAFIMERVKEAADGGLFATLRVVRVRVGNQWRSAAARFDLTRPEDRPVPRSRPRGPVELLDEQISGREFLERLRASLEGAPFIVGGAALDDLQLDQHWHSSVISVTQQRGAWGTPWPGRALLTGKQIRDRPFFLELVEATGERTTLDGVDNVACHVLDMGPMDVMDMRLRGVQLLFWDYQGRVEVTLSESELVAEVDPKDDPALKLMIQARNGSEVLAEKVLTGASTVRLPLARFPSYAKATLLRDDEVVDTTVFDVFTARSEPLGTMHLLLPTASENAPVVPAPQKTASALVLTALEVEFEAVRELLSNVQEVTHEDGTVYECGDFEARGCRWRVYLGQTGAGNVNAGVEAERAMQFFEPDVALFVGVAGGLKDVAVGDVVAATVVHGYERGKDELTFNPRPDLGQSTYALVQRAQAEARRANRESDRPFKTYIGPIAAGEKVIADTRAATYTFLRKQYGDALAVEMEGRGFLDALHKNQSIKGMVIRGISDCIDGKGESDARGSQVLASKNAATFMGQLLAGSAPT